MTAKFIENKYNIKNNRGEPVSPTYLRQYIACYCRGPKYQKSRKDNLEYFASEEFLEAHQGETAAKIAKAAAESERWDEKEPQLAG